MSAEISSGGGRSLDPKRAELIALGGGGVQILLTLLVLIASRVTTAESLWFLSWQLAVGIMFWLITWLHLRLKRSADDEQYDLQAAEQRRKRQGIKALFDEDEQGRAARNLSHLESYVTPAASLLFSASLLLPVFYYVGLWLFKGKGLITAIQEMSPLATDYNIMVLGFFLVGGAFAGLLIGAYAAGLSRQKACTHLRAGAGYTLSSSLFMVFSLVAVGLSSRGWLGVWPDRAVAALITLWMTAQGLEMIANFIFDFYRPRIVGVETRPVYDSRLSGLFAEPQGIFHTFAHTMDYQFGFRISDTWFFRFLEKAFAPLVLIQLVTFWLLTCFVVIEPGEVAIIERWGAPRGVSDLPADDAQWDNLAAPLEQGLRFKYPWPVETALIIPRDRINTLHSGFKMDDEEEAAKKARELYSKTAGWDEEHVKDEYQYLMPLPREMLDDMEGADDTPKSSERDQNERENVLFLSGSFSVEYRVGDRPGDVYRYAYRHAYADSESGPTKSIRSLFERQLTAHLAGAKFWDLMVGNPDKAAQDIMNGLQQELNRQGLGVKVIAINIQNVHPPAGEVGKAYQKVLEARLKKQELIYGGEIEERQILGLIEARENEVIAKAKSYKYSASRIAEAEAERFRSQITAQKAAPGVYETRLRMAAIEEGLSKSSLVIHPEGIEVRLDASKLPSLEEMEVQKGILKQAENP